MSEYVIQRETLTGIADAIRQQLGTQQQYTPEQMSTAIEGISSAQNNWKDIVSGKSTIYIDSGSMYAVDNLFLTNGIISELRMNALLSSGAQPFRQMASLEKVYLPKLESASISLLNNCQKLKWVYFGAVSSISANTFVGDTLLAAVVIDSDEVPSLSTSTILSGTPIASGLGYIYVLDNLVEQYKVATNWSVYADQIEPKSEIPPEIQQWLDEQEGAV